MGRYGLKLHTKLDHSAHIDLYNNNLKIYFTRIFTDHVTYTVEHIQLEHGNFLPFLQFIDKVAHVRF
jgi:hypothetical protein